MALHFTTFGQVGTDLEVPRTRLAPREPGGEFERLVNSESGEPAGPATEPQGAASQASPQDAPQPAGAKAHQPDRPTQGPAPAAPRPAQPAANAETTSSPVHHTTESLPASGESNPVESSGSGAPPPLDPAGMERSMPVSAADAAAPAPAPVVTQKAPAPQPPTAPGSRAVRRTSAVARTARAAPTYRTASPQLAQQLDTARDTVVRRLVLMATREGGKASMTLDPVELGTIDLEVVMDDGALRIQAFAERAEVAELLEQSWHQLADQLENQGLNLEDAEAHTKNPEDPAPGAFEDPDTQRASSDRRPQIGSASGIDIWV